MFSIGFGPSDRVIGLVALLAAVAAGLWYFVLRTPSTRVDLSQALRQYQLAKRESKAQRLGRYRVGSIGTPRRGANT